MKSKVMPAAHDKIRGYLLLKIGGDRIRDVGKTLGFTLDFSCSLLQQSEKLDIEPVE